MIIVVADDWLKRGRPEPIDEPHRLRDPNQRQGFFQKLWTTFLLLVFAALITPLFFVGLQALADPIVREVVHFAAETIAAFYFVLLIYIWWRPKWLTFVYGLVESKLVGTGYLALGMIAIGLIVVILARFVIPLLR